MTNGQWKGSLHQLINSLYWGKRFFLKEHTKNPNANAWAYPESTFWAVRYLPPSPI